MHERGIVEAVLDEVDEIVNLIIAQAQAARRSSTAWLREPARQRSRRSCLGVLRHTGVEIPDDVSHAREQAVVKKEPRVFELPQGQDPELERIAVTACDFPPSIVAEVGILSGGDIQGLERV